MGLGFKIFKDSPKDDKGSHEVIPQIQPVTQQTAASMAGIPDEKFVEMLWAVISQNNIPGQDYIEFKQAVDSMASLPIDEKSKFLTTFSIFQSQGCKKETLISSIDKYVNMIKGEQASFMSEFEAQRNIKVTSKLAQVEEAKRKVEQLTKEISDANAFVLTASQEAQQEEMQLNITAANFNTSVDRVLAAFESDKNKINTYIQ